MALIENDNLPFKIVGNSLINYWYVIEKPPGFNVTDLMRDAPYHMIDVYILAVIVCYLLYVPYLIKDRINKNS